MALSLEYGDLEWGAYGSGEYCTLGSDSTGGTAGILFAKVIRKLNIISLNSQEGYIDIFKRTSDMSIHYERASIDFMIPTSMLQPLIAFMKRIQAPIILQHERNTPTNEGLYLFDSIAYNPITRSYDETTGSLFHIVSGWTDKYNNKGEAMILHEDTQLTYPEVFEASIKTANTRIYKLNEEYGKDAYRHYNFSLLEDDIKLIFGELEDKTLYNHTMEQFHSGQLTHIRMMDYYPSAKTRGGLCLKVLYHLPTTTIKPTTTKPKQATLKQPQKQRTPTPQKQRTPTPQKQRTPTPQKQRTPTPQKQRTPTPQKQHHTPTPQKQRTPTPQKQRTPTPTPTQKTRKTIIPAYYYRRDSAKKDTMYLPKPKQKTQKIRNRLDEVYYPQPQP